MFATVFAKSLYDLRRAVVGWSAGIVALVATMAALWPSIRGMEGIEQFLASYPEGMRELFNVDAITTGAGFLNAELYSILLPALFVVFAISRGARAIAGEEIDGTLEVLVVTPLTRTRLLLDKAAALAVAVFALGLALFAATVAASAAADMGIGVGDAAVGALAMVLLGVEHGWLAMAVGAATGSRALAVGVAAIVAVAGYVLYAAGQLVSALEPWQPLSPFTQAIEGGPLGGGLPLAFAWMALAAVVVLAVAAPVFSRRDLATG